MKKIIFILLALISGTAFAQTSSASAPVNAEIVEPLKIEKDGTTSLNFGKIDGGVGAGTVTVSVDGARTSDNDELLIASSEGDIKAAVFKVTAADNYAYSITIPSISLESGGNTMYLEFTQDLEGATDGTATGDGAEQTLKVGGKLQIGNTQAAGEYTGDVTVTVDYQ